MTNSPWANETPVPFPHWTRITSAIGVTYSLGELPKTEEDYADPKGWFYIAYRPKQEVDMTQLPKLLMILANALGHSPDFSSEKTALVWKYPESVRERYWELHGDFRAEFEAAFTNGPEAIRKVWESHPDAWVEMSIRLNNRTDELDKEAAQSAKGVVN